MSSPWAVEVGQDLGAIGVELVVELAAAAQLAREQHDPQPQEEMLVVDDVGQETRVLDVIDPGVEVGEEVADGAGEEGADVQGRPFLRWRSRTWFLTRARVNWLTSRSRPLRRWYSVTHD
jgi:hypothetical protein